MERVREGVYMYVCMSACMCMYACMHISLSHSLTGPLHAQESREETRPREGHHVQPHGVEHVVGLSLSHLHHPVAGVVESRHSFSKSERGQTQFARL